MRDEWSRVALSTDPADRTAAESAIAELYRLVGASPPEFVWVPSPTAAVEVLRDDPAGSTDLTVLHRPLSSWPVRSRLVQAKSQLAQRLEDRTQRRFPTEPWAWYGPEATAMSPRALAASAESTGRILDSVVRQPLLNTLRDNLYQPMRRMLLTENGVNSPVAGHEQYDTWGLAYFGLLRDGGCLRFGHADAHHLDQWLTLARSAGWWWPGERRCVLAERPAAIHTEAFGDVRLRPHHPDRRAVEFVDGTGIFAVHGTAVPEWVITGPTVELIRRERNIEVRRVAIERFGWDAYIDAAGLELVAAAPDPGNPGGMLRLYHVPRFASSRVLLVLNGSRERDGTRRRYGINVPAAMTDPVAAAGWSYGLSGAQYAQLVRRT